VKQTRLATVGQMAASIAHELRNPLGAARNSAYFLKRYAKEPDAELLEHLRIIDTEIMVAGGIITDLLDVARAKPPSRNDLVLGEIVQEALDRLHLAGGIMSFLTSDPDPFVLNADASQLRQVFQNLLANAAQAVGLEGEIRIQAWLEGDEGVISVRDSGPGVAEDHADRIFEPLFSTRPRGTGLGLTICRDIIERHGGTIELGHTGPGAEFLIRLPVTAP
jgi:signal transduction histidine kinase